MPSQPDPSGDLSLLEWAKQDLRVRHQKPGQAFVGLVHRLDRPAGGLTVFAKTSKAAARLQRQFQEKVVTKTYLAAVHGRPDPPQATLEDWLQKNGKRNLSRVVAPGTPRAKLASLSYRVLEFSDPLALVGVDLSTGRHHQIRVQFSSRGYPLVGDVKYGAKRPLRQAKIALWAWKLGLVHPTTSAPLTFTATPPEHPPWSYFSEQAFQHQADSQHSR